MADDKQSRFDKLGILPTDDIRTNKFFDDLTADQQNEALQKAVKRAQLAAQPESQKPVKAEPLPEAESRVFKALLNIKSSLSGEPEKRENLKLLNLKPRGL